MGQSLNVLTNWKCIESLGGDKAGIQQEYQKTHASEWRKDTVMSSQDVMMA